RSSRSILNLKNEKHVHFRCEAFEDIYRHIADVCVNTTWPSDTAREAGERLVTSYANSSRSRVILLKPKLAYNPKGTRTVTKYLRDMKSIADELALVQNPMKDVDLMVHILCQLWHEAKECQKLARFLRENHVTTGNSITHKQTSPITNVTTSSYMFDTGASNNVDPERTYFHSISEYGGPDEIVLGNGGKRRIKNQCVVGHATLNEDVESSCAPTEAVLTKSKLVPITTTRPVTAAVSNPHVTRPRQAKTIVSKPHSPPRRHINHSPSPKASNFPPKVIAVKAPKVNAVQGNWGNPQHALKDKGVIDSGCSSHMTGNMSYLSGFEEINGGYVAFGGNPKGGKNSGKDIECLVLSPEFKLPDENQVLLRVPRENNMYNVDFKNIVPSGDLTCLFAKATFDESNLWHRRKGHTNFKTMNKLVKGDDNVQQYVLFPVWSSGSKNPQNTDDDTAFGGKKPDSEVYVSPHSSAQIKKHDDKTKREAKGKSHVESSTGYRNLSVEFEDFSNNSINEVNVAVSPVPAVGQISTISTNTFHAAGPSNTAVKLEDITYSNDEEDVGVEADFTNLETTITTTQTRSMTRVVKDQDGLTLINNDDFHTCMFACFLLQEEPKRVHQALKDPSWIEAMQEELLQFKMQKVWVLVDLPNGKRAIGHTQEEGIDYEEVFAPVARIEAIMLFLAYTSFMGFMVYQIDVKSAFLYGTIKEEVYVCQTLGFQDPDYPDKVYKVVKALYGLHQALELVKQKPDGIFISQDKYVADTLRKLGLTDGKSASTPIDTEKPLLKDPDGEDVDVHTYRSMIGSLMYLTSSRPDIMFAVCAYDRFQVTPKASHLLAVKKIFRYLKGKPHLGLWYPKDSLFNLMAYSDSDYAGASLDRKSTTRGCQFLGCRLICWQCKKQIVVATSSTEAEYSTHHVALMKSWLVQKQTALGKDELNLFLVDREKVIVTEATIHEDLRLDDAESIDCLPNEEIFTKLSRIGLVRNVDSSTKFYMYLRFLQLMIRAQVGDISLHFTKYSSPALTQKVFANMRMQADVVVDEGSASVAVDDVPAVIDEPPIPSPTPTTQPPPPLQELPSTSQDVSAISKYVVDVEKDAEIEENAYDDELEPVELKKVVTTAKFMTEMVTAASATITAATSLITAAIITTAPSAARRKKGVVIRDPEDTATPSIIIHSEPKYSDKGKEILDEVIEQVQRKEKEDNAVMRYQALKRKPQTEAQARKNLMIYLRNMAGFKMDYFKGMRYDDISLIFEKKFNSNMDFLEKTKEQMEEEDNKAHKRASESQAEKAAKKQNLDEEVKELKKHLQIVPNNEDDVYTKATPLARKVPVVDYEIYSENNKPYYKIVRADGSSQLFLSFLSLLRNFDREDLEVLWQLVKERFASSKPKNFSDDFLLTTLTYMFEKPDVQAQVWKNQRSVHGLAKVKS
nr:hypothetical protein [Tanacetum cinerariifolium]